MANLIGYTTAAEVERLREGKTAVVQGERSDACTVAVRLGEDDAAGAGPVGEVVAWHDIASAARKPMQPVLLWDGKKVFEGYWGASHFDRKSREWVSAWVSSPTSGDTKPTHWAPLPAGPDAAHPGEEPGEAAALLDPDNRKGPPQPLMHPNAEWCEAYARWFRRAVRFTLSLARPVEEPGEVERLTRERDAGFNHGYLMAVANIINLHRETVVAADVLLQIDLTIDDAESFELAEYDLEALNRLRAEPRAADFFKRQRRTGDAQEGGK